MALLAAGGESIGWGVLCLAIAALLVFLFWIEQQERKEEQRRAEEERRAAREAEERRLRALLTKLEELLALPPREFEKAIMFALGGKVTQGSADEGIDGWAGNIPVQIKKSNNIGRPVVDGFETAVRRAGKSEGWIVALSFTSGAYKEARRALKDGLQIKLLTVEEVISRLQEYSGETFRLPGQ